MNDTRSGAEGQDAPERRFVHCAASQGSGGLGAEACPQKQWDCIQLDTFDYRGDCIQLGTQQVTVIEEKGKHSSGEELTVFRSSPSRMAYPYSKGYTILRHWAYLVFLGEPFPRHWHPPYSSSLYHMVYMKGLILIGGYYEMIGYMSEG